jgi:hypothetical protein
LPPATAAAAARPCAKSFGQTPELPPLLLPELLPELLPLLLPELLPLLLPELLPELLPLLLPELLPELLPLLPLLPPELPPLLPPELLPLLLPEPPPLLPELLPLPLPLLPPLLPPESCPPLDEAESEPGCPASSPTYTPLSVPAPPVAHAATRDAAAMSEASQLPRIVGLPWERNIAPRSYGTRLDRASPPDSVM